MNMRAERFFPELKMDGLSGLVAALREKLEAAQTLVMRPNEHGIYAASASQGEEAASGYQNAWIRDNAMVVFAVCARRCGIGNANGAWADNVSENTGGKDGADHRQAEAKGRSEREVKPLHKSMLFWRGLRNLTEAATRASHGFWFRLFNTDPGRLRWGFWAHHGRDPFWVAY